MKSLALLILRTEMVSNLNDHDVNYTVGKKILSLLRDIIIMRIDDYKKEGEIAVNSRKMSEP